MYLQGLRLHDEEISRLRNTDMKKYLFSKKLYLVLDLDHTLLNTTILGHLSSEELHLLNETDSLEGIPMCFFFWQLTSCFILEGSAQ